MKYLNTNKQGEPESEPESEHEVQEPEQSSYYQNPQFESQQTTQPSCIFEVEPFLEKIEKEVEEKAQILNASFEWTSMIYDLVDYNPDKLSEIVDTQQTWKKIIRYNEAYSLAFEVGKCMNCLQTTNLLNNSCGHTYCKQCWESYLESQYSAQGNLKLFPFCLKEQCKHCMHYQLIAQLKKQNPILQRPYVYNLISKYCRANSSIKFCPNLACGKIIDRSLCKDLIIKCSCGLQLCLACVEESHLPLECQDLEIWNGLVLLDDAKKITMKCFACQLKFQRVGMFDFIQCVCGQDLCWRCQRPWSHQCGYQNCDQKIFRSLISSSKIEYHGPPLCCEKYKLTKDQVDRLALSIERVKTYSSDCHYKGLLNAEILDQMKKIVINAWQIIKKCQIYIFFERENVIYLKEVMARINRIANRVDDYLYGSLLKQEEIKKELLREQKTFAHLINEGKQMIELIKKGNISEAYQKEKYLKAQDYSFNGQDNFYIYGKY